MLFLCGPRQVGKTTSSREAADTIGESSYFNWDDLSAREIILAGPRSVVEEIGLGRLRSTPAICVFDELHKYSGWKTFPKGMFDVYGHQLRIIVTGSARLTVFQAGGDRFLAEVKKSGKRTISPGLEYFKRQINVPHTFQVVFDAPYVNADCFSKEGPIEVPAKTLLSQLV